MDVIPVIVAVAVIGFLLYWTVMVVGAATTAALIMLLPIVAGVLIGIALVISTWQLGHDNVAVLIGIAVLIAISIGQRSWLKYLANRGAVKAKCPKCGSVKAETYASKTYWDWITKTETRRVMLFSEDGKKKGYSEYDVKVPAEAEIFVSYKRCKTCLHQWEESASEIVRSATH